MTRSERRVLQTLLGVGLLLLGGAGRASAQATCDRACLRTMLDQYLDAVAKHDPKAAPLIVGFRQTENAVNVAPGNGVWKTVTGLGKMQRRYFDPVSGQAGYYGLVQEGSSVALVTVRLRVQNRKLTEAEWYLARENDPGLNGPRQPGRPPANLFNPDYLIANPPPDRVVPAAQRLSRDELIGVTQSYFDPAAACSTMVLSGFAGDDQRGYTRFDETHIERAYAPEVVERLLYSAGLEVEALYECFTFQPITERTQRFAWVARKPGLRTED